MSETRRSVGQSRATFYNPMWNAFGDRPAPPGTYYLRTPGALGYYWHMLDQTLVRCSLVPHVEGVHVVADDTLVSRRARTPTASDHLPIELTLSAHAFDNEDAT
jgi:hypothetical protein